MRGRKSKKITPGLLAIRRYSTFEKFSDPELQDLYWSAYQAVLGNPKARTFTHQTARFHLVFVEKHLGVLEILRVVPKPRKQKHFIIHEHP